MKESAYSTKLRDPRWQKLRLKRLEGAKWTCERCGSETKELHVHHRAYVRGREPWEYEGWELSVLCDQCHHDWHDPELQRDLSLLFEAYSGTIALRRAVQCLTCASWSYSSTHFPRRREIRLALLDTFSALTVEETLRRVSESLGHDVDEGILDGIAMSDIREAQQAEA